MRDLETASAVLTVADTGHLVLSTGHAPSAAQSVERIVDMFRRGIITRDYVFAFCQDAEDVNKLLRSANPAAY
jgi:hypothetical protein